MTKLFRLTGAAVLVAAGAACARPAPSAGAETPSIPFEKYTLPNGLDVILSEDHRLPLVAVDVWYHVGPANEAAGRTGFAHLFEHMMFQGSKHVPGDSHFKLVESAGGTDMNGTTSFDRTNYFETLPSNELELGLWLESDRMGYLLDAIDLPKFARQQDVVRNERRQSIENQPYGIVQDALFQTVYPKGHPYYANVMGSHADIQAARLDDVKAFFKEYYRPNNASLAIVGDFDKAAARQLVDKYFGPLARGPEVPKVTVQTPPITAERRLVVKDRVRLPRVYMAWITPAFFAPGDADADAAANALGGGDSSRLYKALVYQKQIAQDVSAAQFSMALGSMFQIVVTARPGHTPEEVEAAVTDEVERFRREGPDENEVERARNTFETGMLQGLEVLGGSGGVADTLNMFNHYTGDPGYLPKYLDDHRKLTPASVKAFAEHYLAPNARVVIHAVPGQPDFGPAVPTPPAPKVAAGTGSEAVNADAPWRAARPPAGPAKAASVPPPASFTLPNGLTVIYQTRSGLPVVSASVVFKTGSDENPPDKPGLANFMASMLDQGTASRDALKMADETAQVGASLGASSTKDSIYVSTSALVRNFETALGLLADITLHPAFPQAEVDRQRASRLARLEAAQEDPTTLASMAAVKALYGPQHPYGFIELGTPAAATATTRDDLVGLWKQTFVPSNAALVVSGALTRAELEPLVAKVFGAWPSGTMTPPVIGEPHPTDARIVIVDTPGSPQTQLTVVGPGAARATPDYAALNVMNDVLGGLFSSRINLNLRQDHGYAYGASSEFIFRKMPGPFWIQSAVRTDATAPSVTEIFKEVRRIAASPMSPDELTMAKDALVRSLPSAFETNTSTVGTVGDLFVYGLGLDYYSKYPALIGGVTAEAAQAAAKKYLDPDRLIVVAVGDKAKIEAPLRKLNLGKVEVSR